jgi:hypothetical protein
VSAGAEIKQNGRPLEPDAGNADAGRPAVLFQHGFIFLSLRKTGTQEKGFLDEDAELERR